MQNDSDFPTLPAAPVTKDLKLALDLRVASEKPETATLIDAFMAQYKESVRAEDFESAPLALSSPQQEWGGHLKVAPSEKKLMRWSLFDHWERDFAETSKFGVWHQFAPVDGVRGMGTCPTLVTVLPPGKNLPNKGKLSKKALFMVPSEKDSLTLQSKVGVPAERIRVVAPAIRPFVMQAPMVQRNEDGWLLFLIGNKKDLPKVDRWIQIISGRFPKAAKKIISLETGRITLQEPAWLEVLQRSRMCFYLSNSPFDWAVPALEAMYTRIPTVFLEDCHALSDRLPKSPLSLPRFLLEMPEAAQLQDHADETFSVLRDSGVFEPGLFTKQVMELYQELAPAKPPVSN